VDVTFGEEEQEEVVPKDANDGKGEELLLLLIRP
jgi:hypothetical protein